MRLTRNARLAALTLLLLLPLVTLAQKLEVDTDRHGDDFRDFDLPSPDPLLCRKACVEDDQCGSFTYLKPDTGPGSPQVAHCWLKVGTPAPHHDPAFISGVVPAKSRLPKPLPPGKPGEWTLQLTSSGGIAFRLHKLSVKSNGHFARVTPSHKEPEEGSVPAAALEKLNRTILAAKITTWKQNYNLPGDDGCCDRVSTGLSLDVCGSDGKWTRYQGHWVSPSPMPPDLEAVLEALRF